MSSYSQSSRLGRLLTVLGSDVLVLQRFSGQEGMSALFAFEVDCLAASADIDFDALIGTHATVTLTTRAGERPFDGIVTEAKWLGAGENGQRYRLILRPWFFLASLRRNQRIFHNKTVVQILEELLGAYADAGALKPQLTADYPVLEYTVQFRESDLDFACRLMERHGISYHFQHHAGQHDMVLTDMAASHTSIGARPFHPDEGHHQEDIEHFWQWRPARRITTGAIRLTDYNFKTPNAAMEVDRPGDAAYAQGKIESFDWPGGYLDQGRGRTVAALRSDGERGQDRRFEALGDVADLGAGLRVTLSGDKVPGLGDDYLCLAASHSYTSDNYGSGGPQGDELAYRGVYVLMPASAPMLPELKTARADVKGPQTAVVVGEGEIDCDEYGRILVKFHWDLQAAHSMRCRVSQNWAGNGWGGMVIPRIGMEVVVEFLDGDPDQPLVTGCVYNAANMPPYALPANKTRSTFKTRTHQGRGFNELRFEDEKGKEEIFVHGQKDRNTKIENNQSERVNVNKVESVGHNKASEIENNLLQVVDGNMELRVGPGNRNSITPAGAKDYPEGLPRIPDRFGPAGSDPGTGDLMISVEQNKLQTVGANHDEAVKGNKVSDVKKNYDLTVGKEIVIDAGDRITLICGQTRIVMEDNGVITVNAKKIHVTADALITLLADLVKIN
jgi:type VI secretion system secreted protein VgrG